MSIEHASRSRCPDVASLIKKKQKKKNQAMVSGAQTEIYIPDNVNKIDPSISFYYRTAVFVKL